MKFKTLKHKIIEDTFGVIVEVEHGNFEIGHCNIPKLQPMTAGTIEDQYKYWQQYSTCKMVLEQLHDYNFVEVEVNVI